MDGIGTLIYDQKLGLWFYWLTDEISIYTRGDRFLRTHVYKLSGDVVVEWTET